jgi:transcriptional regulator with XRE-family HTH domain
MDDKKLIERFIKRCARKRMTQEQMGKAVGRSRNWASFLASGRISRLQFRTRNRILEYMGEL